jgi:hypothetical protein
LELLLAISISLNRDFHANLGPELNLPRDHPISETGAKEMHFVMIGGSHTNKTAPHLRSMGIKVTDLSISGWVSNIVNGQQLMGLWSDPPHFPRTRYSCWTYWVIAAYSSNRLMKAVCFPFNSMGTITC